MFIRPSMYVEIIELKDVVVFKDYFTGKVFVVEDSPKKDILKDAINGTEIEKLIDKYKEDFYLFWKELSDLQLVELSEDFTYYNDNISFGGVIPKFYSNNHKKDIRNIEISIGGMCRNHCNFCNKEVEKECLACSYNEDNDKITYDIKILKEFLSNIINFSSNKIINITFSGIINYKNIDFMEDIVNAFKHKQVSFLIITPEFELSDITIQFLKIHSFLIYLQIVNENSLKFYNILSQNQKVIPILRVDDFNIVNELNRKGIHYIRNYEIDKLIKNYKFRGDDRYFIDSPSFESKVIGAAGLRCLFGRIYIDCNGRIHSCKLYEAIGNINALEKNLWKNLWKEYTNSSREVHSCIYCRFRNSCSICTYYNKKYCFVKCEYDDHGMKSDAK